MQSVPEPPGAAHEGMHSLSRSRDLPRVAQLRARSSGEDAPPASHAGDSPSWRSPLTLPPAVLTELLLLEALPHPLHASTRSRSNLPSHNAVLAVPTACSPASQPVRLARHSFSCGLPCGVACAQASVTPGSRVLLPLPPQHATWLDLKPSDGQGQRRCHEGRPGGEGATFRGDAP